MSNDGVYESAVVCTFVDAHLEDERPLPFAPRVARQRQAARLLNGRRLTQSHKEMLARWAAKPTVTLAKVDAFLHHYGLMTWELEVWAEAQFGRSGYLQPLAA